MSSEPPRVAIGQVWEDLDPRQHQCRRVRIVALGPDAGIPDGYALVETVQVASYTTFHGVVETSGEVGKRSRVQVARLRPRTNGYRLVEEPA